MKDPRILSNAFPAPTEMLTRLLPRRPIAVLWSRWSVSACQITLRSPLGRGAGASRCVSGSVDSRRVSDLSSRSQIRPCFSGFRISDKLGVFPLLSFGRVWEVNSFKNVWLNSPMTPSNPGLFFVGRFSVVGSVSSVYVDFLVLLDSVWEFVCFWEFVCCVDVFLFVAVRQLTVCSYNARYFF